MKELYDERTESLKKYIKKPSIWMVSIMKIVEDSKIII